MIIFHVVIFIFVTTFYRFLLPENDNESH
ncbi:putative membrane protein [Yersinia pestis]|nr:putative membrane protein [Yersinia pestis]